jgi:hypothetical protein
MDNSIKNVNFRILLFMSKNIMNYKSKSKSVFLFLSQAIMKLKKMNRNK